MPIVSSGKVLVTGANGFVAMWIVESLLRHGYFVRAVVRTEGKGVPLLRTFANAADRLEITVVEDFTVVRGISVRSSVQPFTSVLFIGRCL